MRSPKRRNTLPETGGTPMMAESQEDKVGPGVSGADVVIAVMGVTGAGKSTFISLLTKGHVEIGHGLESTTQRVQVFSFPYGSNKTGYIIDTPGFDDTTRSDTEILKEISFHLNKIYCRGLRLCGLIYLHRITDPRMGGSGVKNLEVFKRLCGASAFRNVRLVTTRWNEVPKGKEAADEVESREAQLKSNDRFWGPIIKDGGQVMRHSGTRESAESIVTSLIEKDQKERRAVLDIQREMIDEKLPLAQTAAGGFLSREYEQMQQKYEADMKELQDAKADALRDRDQEGIAMLEAQENDYLMQRQKNEDNQKGLELTFANLDAEKSPDILGRLRQIEPLQPDGLVDDSLRTDIKLLEHNVAQIQDNDERRDRQQRKLEADLREHKAEISRLRAKLAQEKASQQKKELEDRIRLKEMSWEERHPRRDGGDHHHFRSTMRDPRAPVMAVSNNPLLSFWKFVIGE